MVASYYRLLATLLCLASYKQCSTQLLKVLHKYCNMDVLGVLLIYPHSPSGAAYPRDCAYISVKPLAAVLQYIILDYHNYGSIATYSKMLLMTQTIIIGITVSVITKCDMLTLAISLTQYICNNVM